MHKCLPRDATYSAVFAVVRCPSVRLFVTLMYRNGQFYYQIFLSPAGPIILVFHWNSDGGHPQQGRQIEVGIPKICDFQPVFQKYRYRIPRYFKIPIPNTEPTWKKYQRKYRIPIPTPNTDTDPALVSSGSEGSTVWHIINIHKSLTQPHLSWR